MAAAQHPWRHVRRRQRFFTPPVAHEDDTNYAGAKYRCAGRRRVLAGFVRANSASVVCTAALRPHDGHAATAVNVPDTAAADDADAGHTKKKTASRGDDDDVAARPRTPVRDRQVCADVIILRSIAPRR
jgi:hypothetical protein